MKGISQVVLAILLVGVAIAAGTMLSYIVTDIVTTYRPSEVIVARVGVADVEFKDVCNEVYCMSDGPCPCPVRGYKFVAYVKLANLGTEPLRVTGGDIVVLVKGTTGRAKIVRCSISQSITINPGEITKISGECIIPFDDLKKLFGSERPSADIVKKSMNLLFISIHFGSTNRYIF